MSEARAALDFMQKKKRICDIAMNKVIIGVKGRFHLKQYVRYVEQVKTPEKKILLGEHGVTNV
jgi:hypothetical protein